VGKLNEIAAGLKEPEMTFHAPFLDARMDRTQIVQMGLEVGAPLELTSSCIRGWKVNCGICCQCLNRQKAFRYLGVKYE
jgi:7-cyano-7-deazaguanine synthase